MENKNENQYNKKVFVNNLKHYIQEKGVTQRGVAEALGMSQGAFSDWMQLRTYPRMDKIQKLAEYFGIEKSDLVEDRNVKNKYYLNKEIKGIEKNLGDSPEAVELFLAIEKLSDANRAIVKALVDSLNKEGK
jgi:transcriptional regulator with XRE-family HTH domain